MLNKVEGNVISIYNLALLWFSFAKNQLYKVYVIIDTVKQTLEIDVDGIVIHKNTFLGHVG